MMIDPEFSSDIYAVQSWLNIHKCGSILTVPVFDPVVANDEICKAL